MATFGDIKDNVELITQCHLERIDVGKVVNRVAREETESRQWWARKATANFNSVAIKEAGTVAATNGSTTITGTGTAFDSSDVGKVLRVGESNSLLFVGAVTNATTLTLTKGFPEETQSGSGYQLFPLFYTAPTDCDEIQQITQRIRLVETTREELNRTDPTRRVQGTEARRWAPGGRSDAGLLLFELWPVPSGTLSYRMEYVKSFQTLVNDGDRPMVPCAVVENKAIADVAMAIFARRGDTKWHTIAVEHQKRFTEERESALIIDREKYGSIQQVMDPYDSVNFGHDYLVDHDV